MATVGCLYFLRMSPSAAARTVLFSVATFIALLLAALAIAGAAEAAPVPLKAKAVEVGASRVCAIKQDGGVICWGNNNGGALGHGGAEAYSNTPVTVSGLPGVSSLAAGATDQVCAVATTGSAYCWGQNHLGQVGDGTETDRRSPVKVAGISGVSQIGAGFHFTCAVATAGTVHCWGSGQNGQHGDGLKQRRSVPGPVSGISGAVQVEGGDLHACARLGGGTVYCWGDNVYGQLGDGTDDNRFTPVAVSGLTGTKAIALGSKRTCAVKSDGTVACWGLNGSYGVLGDGTTTNRLLPTQVVGLSGAKDVAIGSSFACALLESGGVSCWGRNNSGQLGDGTRTDRKTAAPVKGLSDAVALSLESSTACALRANTEVVCWGTNVASIKDETVPSRFLVPTTVAFEGVGDGGADGGPGGPGGGNAGGGKKAPARFAADRKSVV